MAQIVPHLLFAVERYDHGSKSVRIIGGVIIALEDPIYVGRLLVGGDTVEDKSDWLCPAVRPNVSSANCGKSVTGPEHK